MLLRRYQADLGIAGLIFLLGFASAYLICQNQLAVARRRMNDYQQRLRIYQVRAATVAQRWEQLQLQLAGGNGGETESCQQLDQLQTAIKGLTHLLEIKK